ncbi:molybdopterin molybdotransferase MoeA [Spongiimicrobium sp. 3-5]|uniref:molybdopterin molybdotransferase MoeA n=1 Tax=Spongiimicrobium sp. 3-5 TaxID=3332596 RepID=UPI0039815C08
MITFQEAYEKVLAHSQDYGTETVLLKEATGRVLAESVLADRDFPPFNRSTKDGIVINYNDIASGITEFRITHVIAAGTQQSHLKDIGGCMEIMTGAVIPEGGDTVIMYEEVVIQNGMAKISQVPKRGQNIHIKGDDEKKGAKVLEQGCLISAAEIGVLAAVGKATVLVKCLPKIGVIATGNELVAVADTPLPHQIRKSNTHSLHAALADLHIQPEQFHLEDDKAAIETGLLKAMEQNNVLLLSGGVSKGKFDFIPEVMDKLGVQKVFHRVLQRPGKPFWFGKHKLSDTLIFSFPGNPVSTFANYHIYFKPWFNKSLGLPVIKIEVILAEDIEIKGTLTRFLRVKVHVNQGRVTAVFVTGNGSGDLTSLAKSDGFVLLSPKETPYEKGEWVPFIPTRNIMV